MKLPIALLLAGCAGIVSIISLLAVLATAQQLIGAKAGVIQYAPGEVFIDKKPFQLTNGSFRQLEKGQALSTKKGYAEVVLAPAAYLRLGEDALFRMLNNRLDETHLELIQGSALIEVIEKVKTNPIVVHISKSTVEIKKAGWYRLDAIPGELRVYSGAALAKNGGKKIQANKGRMVRLDGDFARKSFNLNAADALHLWAIIRSSVNAYWRIYGYRRPYPKPVEPDPELKALHDRYERERQEAETNAIREQMQQQQFPGKP